MKKLFLMMCLFLPLTGHAGLNVLADLGGECAGANCPACGRHDCQC